MATGNSWINFLPGVSGNVYTIAIVGGLYFRQNLSGLAGKNEPSIAGTEYDEEVAISK